MRLPTRPFVALSLALVLSIPVSGQQQRVGAIAFLRNETVKALGITVDQQDEIRKVVDATRPEFTRLMRQLRSGDGDPQVLRQQVADLRRKALQSVLELLDQTQRQEWEKIAAAAPQRGPRDLELTDIVRVRPGARGPRGGTGLRVFETEAHPVAGKGYLVLTDHIDPVALQALDRLAEHRGGHVLTIEDLAALSQDEEARDALRAEISAEPPRFVAIAPRLASYRENTVLSMWEILSHIDDDPQLDVLPGFLVASTPERLAALVDRSIAYRPVPRDDFRAFAIAEVPPDLLYKSFESSGLLKKLFAAEGVAMADLTIPSSEEISSRSDYPEIEGEGRFEVRVKRRGDLIDAFPEDVQAAIEDAAFLWVLGHGKPGVACSARVSAYTDMDLADKIIFCGACFAASAPQSDLVIPRSRPGEKVEDKPRFALEVIDDGCVVVIGNMAMSRGVHFLLPVLEDCLSGLTVGEAFQRAINAQLGAVGFADAYVEEPVRAGSSDMMPRNMSPVARRANQLVYVLIGDPAIRPFGQFR